MNHLKEMFRIATMKEKTKKVATSIMTVALIGSLITPISANAYGRDEKLVLTYDANDPLYAATHFHMFANEKLVNENVHTHGNIAAKEAETHEFGTRYDKYPDGKSQEYSYIGKLVSADSNALAGTLILGYGHKIISEQGGQTVVENPDGKRITLNHISSSQIYIEPKNFRALDLDAEFQKLKTLSATWGKQKPNSNIIYSIDVAHGADMNNRYIDCKNIDMTKGKVFGKIDYSAYSSSANNIKVLNVDSNNTNKGLLIFNIDLKGAGKKAILTLNQGLTGVAKDGKAFGNDEWKPSDFATCRIIYNLVDSSSADGLYHGTVEMTGTISGSILAPAADITVGAVNGTVVAKNIVHSGQESHRWDVWPEEGMTLKEYVEEKPTTEKPTTEKPTTEKPTTEKPTTEKPTTEKPTTEKPTTEKPTTEKPTTEAPTTEKVTTEAPTTEKVTTEATTTEKVTTEVPTTEATTEAITTEATTEAITTEAPKKDNANTETGELEIVVTDEVTDEPVPGAKVEVTDSNGNKTVYTTDKDGKVVVKDTPSGDHTVVVTEVPKGYTVTTNKEVDVNVSKNESTKKTVTKNKKDQKNAKKALKKSASIKTGDESDDSDISIRETEVTAVGAKNNKKISSKYNKKLKSYKKKHKKQAKEVAAWITIAGTKINYPVMYTGYGKNNDKYLHKNIDGEKDPHGMIFASYLTPKRRISYNVVIYGHNMKDRTMFADLDKYAKQSFYKKHKYVKIDTQGYNYVYEVVDVLRVSCASGSKDRMIYTKFADINNKKVFNKWKKQVAKNRQYKCTGKYTRNDDLMILSTCEYTKNNGRLVVLCKQVKCSKVK